MSALDTYKNVFPGLESPITRAVALVPSDAADLTHVTRAIHVSLGGDLKVTLSGGQTVTFTNVAGRLASDPRRAGPRSRHDRHRTDRGLVMLGLGHGVTSGPVVVHRLLDGGRAFAVPYTLETDEAIVASLRRSKAGDRTCHLAAREVRRATRDRAGGDRRRASDLDRRADRRGDRGRGLDRARRRAADAAR